MGDRRSFSWNIGMWLGGLIRTQITRKLALSGPLLHAFPSNSLDNLNEAKVKVIFRNRMPVRPQSPAAILRP